MGNDANQCLQKSGFAAAIPAQKPQYMAVLDFKVIDPDLLCSHVAGAKIFKFNHATYLLCRASSVSE